ncbi:undecaprenyl-phosphate glucose phosphotransferase, partial [Pseudomonas syringae pv. tagetis]
APMSWFALALGVLGGYRLLIRLALHPLRRHGFNTRRVAIVGTCQVGERLARSLSLEPCMGLTLLGLFVAHQQQNYMETGK